ncbi:MAG: prolyl oligopeptidase family serine peptidase [Chloroflexi bacterium]|nr:prolyl oligopeptidase family serine peptidase [Chloroflexota bacterium]
MNKHIPTIDELIELPQPDDAQIAPNGTHVAYIVRTPDWEQNEHISQIWMVETDADQATPRQLTFAKEGSKSPRWSPDGQWLAFLSKRQGDEHAQIYRMSPFGGEAERLTELETDVQTIKWSPDGECIAYTTPDPESDVHKQRKEKYGDYHVEDRDYVRSHLWLLRLKDTKCHKLTDGKFHVTNFDWHPDGDRIAFEAWPTPDFRDWDQSCINVVDITTLKVTPLTQAGSGSPRWSPNGSQIAFSRCGTPTYYANNELCVMSGTGGDARVISEDFDEEIWLRDWGADGIYFMAIQRTAIHLFCIDPGGGKCTQLTPNEPRGWVSMEASFSQDATRAAMIGLDATHCAEVVVLDTASGETRRLTDFNALIGDWQLGQHEVFQWTSGDGTPVEGVLLKPVDFDPEKQYPLLVVIHGGPTWASLQGLLFGYERLYYPLQQWAAKGALILQPNYRGSAGYGAAFRALNVRNLGTGDYEDVISGVDALIECGWVDAERVGAMGWSQGGYISAFITTYSERFKAVSVGAGIASWYTYYVNTDIHPFTRQYLEAMPWNDAEIYQKTAPITYVNQAQTPTLIQHGEFDRRVPIANAYELYQGLQDVGVEVKLVVYKGMPHGITKPRLNRQVVQENLDWFNRWIWDKEPEAHPAPPCYVTFCSAEKRQDEGDLPAIERYTASRIHDVYHWARRDSAGFYIFSGQFGLLRPSDPIPWYDHVLQPKEVSEMAVRVAEQLKAQDLHKLVVYTGKTEEQPEALIYLGCLQVAAGMVGDVTVEHREISDDGW